MVGACVLHCGIFLSCFGCFLDMLFLICFFTYLKEVGFVVECPKPMNVFERIESVKCLLEPFVPDRDGFRIRGFCRRCIQFRLGQVEKLNGDEAGVYDLLLAQKLNPKTVYEWFLLEGVPGHLKEKLEKNGIGLKEAREEFVKWKRFSGSRVGNELMEEIRNVIGRLRWKSQEESLRM